MLCTLDKCCRKETHERVYQTANRAPVCSCAYVWENASHWHAGRMEIEPCTSIAAVERLDMWAESEIRLCQVVYGLMFSTWIFIIVIVRGVLFFFLPPLPPSFLPPPLVFSMKNSIRARGYEARNNPLQVWLDGGESCHDCVDWQEQLDCCRKIFL